MLTQSFSLPLCIHQREDALKELKKIKKKLRQIDNLELKMREGQQLEPSAVIQCLYVSRVFIVDTSVVMFSVDTSIVCSVLTHQYISRMFSVDTSVVCSVLTPVLCSVLIRQLCVQCKHISLCSVLPH